MTSGVKMVILERVPLDVLWTSLQMFLRTLQCIPHHIHHRHICIYTWLLFFWMVSWFWEPPGGFYGITSFQVDLHSMFTACFLDALTNPFITRNHHTWFVVVVTRVIGPSAMALVLILTLLSAHAGNLHLASVCKYFSYCCNTWGLK